MTTPEQNCHYWVSRFFKVLSHSSVTLMKFIFATESIRRLWPENTALYFGARGSSPSWGSNSLRSCTPGRNVLRFAASGEQLEGSYASVAAVAGVDEFSSFSMNFRQNLSTRLRRSARWPRPRRHHSCRSLGAEGEWEIFPPRWGRRLVRGCCWRRRWNVIWKERHVKNRSF